MKLLLTSAGLTNSSIGNALKELVSKNPSDSLVAYVPTASNAEPGNKDWVIKDFINLYRFGFNNIDIVDPTAAGIDWKKRMEPADIIYLSGGNTFHLLDQFRKTGLDKWLNEKLADKVYVGVSASTIIAGPTIEELVFRREMIIFLT